MTASLDDLARARTDGTSFRFQVVHYLPTYAAIIFVLSVLWSGAPAKPPSITRVVTTVDGLSATQLLVLGLLVTLLSAVLQPLQLSLIQFIEGYGDVRLLRAPRAWGLRRHRGRYERLNEVAVRLHTADDSDEEERRASAAAAWKLERLYPPDIDQLMPTSLGNVLRGMEQRAGAAYGYVALTAWPRLYPVLGETVRRIIDDRRNVLDFASRVTVTSAATGLITGLLLLPHAWWTAVGLMPLALSWLAYRATIQAALAFREAVVVAFDLHRFDLLSALNIAPPRNLAEDQEIGHQLSAFWSGQSQTSPPYSTPPATAPHTDT
jgi:hypothetical protein